MPTIPYTDAIEYLEEELSKYLPIRAVRINSERQIREMSQPAPDEKTVGEKERVVQKEMERRVHNYHLQEKQIRDEIDARLQVTREAVGEPGFALDLLNGGLDFDARLVLLTLTASALGVTENSLAEIGMSFYGTACVDDLMTMLNVKTIIDRLRVRKLLWDLTGQGLIVLNFPSKDFSPEDFNSVSVSISRRAFAVILDDPSLLDEGVTSKETH